MRYRARIFLLLWEVLFVAVPVTAGTVLPGHWALVVSNADYPEVSLRYTIADADLIAQLLEKAGFQVIKVIDATYCEIARSFATLAHEMAEERKENPAIEQIVVFYYSGHGLAVPDVSGDEEDGLDGAIIPVDADLSNLALVIPDDILNVWLDQLGPNTKVIVIFDCGGMGAKGLAASGRLILAGSAKDQCTWEDAQLGHGVFTYYLVEGLCKGEKDAEGRISVQAAFRYAQERISEYLQDRFGISVEPEMADGIGEPIFLFEKPATCPTLPELEESGGAVAK